MNTQPVEKPVDGLDANGAPVYEIINIFHTIQGEGPLVGMPAFFIRLAGCNLQCPLCDTDYTTGRMYNHVNVIVNAVMACKTQTRLIVLTGGEPFRQPIEHLAQKFLDIGFRVQVETNGTLYRENFPYHKCTIVCSPKTPVINDQLRPHISALKYVVQAGHIDPGDGLPTSVLGLGLRPARPFGLDKTNIYVQPADEGTEAENRANLTLAKDSCMKFGYRMCLQTHKLLGLP